MPIPRVFAFPACILRPLDVRIARPAHTDAPLLPLTSPMDAGSRIVATFALVPVLQGTLEVEP